MNNLRLSLVMWAIGHCQNILLWLQSQRFALVEAQLDEIEKKDLTLPLLLVH